VAACFSGAAGAVTWNVYGENRTIQPFQGAWTASQVDPFQWYSTDPRKQAPTDSLSLLYPEFASNLTVFGCPNTEDKPNVYYNPLMTPGNYQIKTLPNGTKVWELNYISIKRLWSVFGDASLVTAGADVVGRANVGPFWSSYGYTHRVSHGQAGANFVVMADMDESGFTSNAATSNHPDGANVMKYDGHVMWTKSPYCSVNPLDHIFHAQAGEVVTVGGVATYPYAQWDAETDSYVDRP